MGPSAYRLVLRAGLVAFEGPGGYDGPTPVPGGDRFQQIRRLVEEGGQ